LVEESTGDFGRAGTQYIATSYELPVRSSRLLDQSAVLLDRRGKAAGASKRKKTTQNAQDN
jgi:hypothetical protein